MAAHHKSALNQPSSIAPVATHTSFALGQSREAMIEEVTGLKVTDAQSEIRVSGSLENHYAPEATVVLDTEPNTGDGYIAMSDKPTPAGVIRLAAPESIEDYARILYASLRDGDSQKLEPHLHRSTTGRWPCHRYL